jgi:hypothetical protein
VSYAILYDASENDFIHVGWWRNQFGPGTQRPHGDPIAINLPLKIMTWVADWTPVDASRRACGHRLNLAGVDAQ